MVKWWRRVLRNGGEGYGGIAKKCLVKWWRGVGWNGGEGYGEMKEECLAEWRWIGVSIHLSFAKTVAKCWGIWRKIVTLQMFE